MSWSKLFLNAHIATMTGENYGIIEHGALALQQDKIAWIGPERHLPHQNAEEIIDLQQQWILPGLIDCHTHLVYAGNRAHEFKLKLQGKSYAEIAAQGGGILHTVKATRACSFADLYAQSEKRLLALMREGVTTLEIKSGYGLDRETEIKMLRVARQFARDFPVTVKTSFLGAHTLPAEYTQNRSAYLDFICEDVLPRLKAENLADFIDAYCETIAFSRVEIEKLFQRAQSLNIPVKLHADQLSDMQGARLAASYHAVSADHLEYTGEDGIQAMQSANTVAVLLPGAFYFLKEKQAPPLQLLRRYKIPIAVATDCNPGSSPVASLLLMLNMACVFFGLTPEEALQGITLNAAKALNLHTTHGSLELGKIADCTIWPIQHPEDLIYNIGLYTPAAVIKNGIRRANTF